MSKQVFISHSSSDADIASRICNFIEGQGIKCWIAPRDVRSGYYYDDEIVHGIDNSRAMIVLVSDQSNNSIMVRKEIELAINHGNSIFPIRIQNVEPEKKLKFLLTGIHWLNAWEPPLEEHLKRLIQVLHELLGESNEEQVKQVNSDAGIKKTTEPVNEAIKDLAEHTFPPAEDKKKDNENTPEKTKTSVEEVPSKTGIPKAIDPSIIILVEIKTRKCDSRNVDGCTYNTFLSSNVAAIYNQNLSSDCSYDNYLWILDQALDSGNDEIMSSRYLLLALEYAKRHRRDGDYELIQRDFNKAPYIVQEIVIKYLSGSPLREILFVKAKEWILTVRYRELQGQLVKILGSFSTKEVINPLIDIVLLQNHNSIEALNILSNYHEERLYKIACDSLYGESGWIIGAAAKVIAKYPEYTEQSIECLTNALFSALNSYGSETATESILKAMWTLNPDETVDYCIREMNLFIANESSVKGRYLDFICMLNTDQISLDSKVKLLKLRKEILNYGDLPDRIKKLNQEKIEELEKQLR